MNWQLIITNPMFWGGFLEATAKTIESASPDYTQAHKLAAFVDHVMGGTPISTPDAASRKNLAEAIGEGIKSVYSSVIAVAQASASAPLTTPAPMMPANPAEPTAAQ
jgi:hypothetical protein